MAKLEDVLDKCLSGLTNGEITLEECMASYPQYADELRRLVAVANRLERGQKIHPSAAFKTRLRAQVITHANAHRHKRVFFGWWDNILSLRLAFKKALNFALGAAAIVLFFLLTPTVLAQRALPGDALYPWKLASEQVLRLLDPDPLHAELRVAERRIQDLTRVVGTPQAEAVVIQGYQETLAELSYYSNPQDQQRISETLLQQKAELERLQLTVPALDQLVSDVTVPKTNLQLDYAAETVEAERITYQVTITNHGPTTPITATLVHTFSPAETLVSTSGASCHRSDNGELVCEIAGVSTNTPRNLSLTTIVEPCYSGLITSTATVTGTGKVVNVNQDNQMVANTPIMPPHPDYAQVAYVQSNGRTHDLGLVTTEDTHQLHLRAAAPALSPDGSQLAFFGEAGISDLGVEYRQGNGVWVVDVVNGEAQNPKQLVAQDHVKNIAWSPDGTKLAFEVSQPDISADIVVVDTEGGRQISRFPGTQPTWSNDSQKLAIRTCAPDCGLWLVNFDGSGLEQITFDSSDSYPSWSPTGQYLAFASQQRDDNWEIYSLRLSDNHVTRLTDRVATDTTPVFGPCGQDIYLRTDYYGSWWITAMKLDGSDERQVKEGVGSSDDWGLARPAIR